MAREKDEDIPTSVHPSASKGSTGDLNGGIRDELDSRPTKRIKTNDSEQESSSALPTDRRAVAPIKPEYLVAPEASSNGLPEPIASHSSNAEPSRGSRESKKKKAKGQNTNRRFGSSRDEIQLCMSRARVNEFAPNTCPFGDSCKFEHDIRKYLAEGRRGDLDTFNGACPILEAFGKCHVGWRCRFASAHSEERTLEDGRKELVLPEESNGIMNEGKDANGEDLGTVNIVSSDDKIKMRKKQITTPKSDAYNAWLNSIGNQVGVAEEAEEEIRDKSLDENLLEGVAKKLENRATYKEPPFLPSEKRRIYYGPETPILAPLTTQGNLPYRRLCVELGAQVTWSEMAMGLPLVQGEKAEWALMKAHETEIKPPIYTPKSAIIDSYDNAKDLKFGAQIAGNKPWIACKTAEILTAYCPHLRAIDLNCGCPIDLVYKQGAGSALLDTPGKLEKILRGMNAVSNEVPITVKIRMGTRDNKPTAARLVSRLAFGGPEAYEQALGPAGVAAITLHGRSRQQRYTRSADWGYISECAAVIQQYRSERDALVDTIRSPDPRDLASPSAKQTSDTGAGGQIYFIGNGDVYSHADYYEHLNPSANLGLGDASNGSEDQAAVDAVMVARGALMKPWIFEEIATNQYLDKRSSERLQYIERFVRYGLQAWGSDEVGVGTTRRFLLEWLSFACRYVPIGLLEHLPPRIQDRPPSYRGRDELEILMASDNYKDWIKISEMFLGPAHKDFSFVPKHKSNAYETAVEG